MSNHPELDQAIKYYEAEQSYAEIDLAYIVAQIHDLRVKLGNLVWDEMEHEQ